MFHLYNTNMFFSCFCSNKKYLKDNVISIEKLVKIDNIIKTVNPQTNETILQKELPDTIITTTNCFLYGKKYIIVCTKNMVYILDEFTFNEIHSFHVEEEILCSTSEKIKAHFYIGSKSGRITVYSIKILNNKFICTDIWTFYCFRPVYNIVVQVERIQQEVRRNVFAGFSPWGNEALEPVRIC